LLAGMMPETPGSSGDEPPRAGTAPAIHQPGSPADVLARQAGSAAISQINGTMSKRFHLFKQIRALRDALKIGALRF
jgi:hypothetical protein